MVPIQNVMTVGPIWNTGGTETEITVPVSVLDPQWAGTKMGGDHTEQTKQYQKLTTTGLLGVSYIQNRLNSTRN